MDVDRHVRWSLVCVAVFLTMGLWLEAMMGLRTRGWMDDTLRRELLRLGHAHGGLLGLLNLALAWAMERLSTPLRWARRIRVAALMAAVCVGGGFVLGGLLHGPTDPGPAILLVPAGAMTMLACVVAVSLVRPEDSGGGR